MNGFGTVVKIILALGVLLVLMKSCGDETPSLPSSASEQLPDPQQSSSSEEPFAFGAYTITPLADFTITARVLSSERYRFGREAELSPVDLALGWGPMANENVLKSIEISQSNRWYYWRTQKLSIPRREIETHSANMHMIPKDDAVKSVLLNADEGDVVTIEGALVRVNAGDGWFWKSSLTRNDTGNGACEVVFVESAAVR